MRERRGVRGHRRASASGHHRPTGSEAERLLQLQRRAGNHAVSTLVARQAATRRQPNAALDLEVPDFAVPLDRAVVARVQALLDEDKFQEAIDRVVAAAASMGIVDASLLHGRKVLYTAGLQGGLTRAQFSARMRPPSGPWELVLDRQSVRLGRSVMSSPAMLYGALLHEWRHVRMNVRWNGAPLSAPPVDETFEISALPGLDERGREVWQELDAYCWQIEHAREIGHSGHEIRQLLHNIQSLVGASLSRLSTLPATIADPARARYSRAVATARQLLANIP